MKEIVGGALCFKKSEVVQEKWKMIHIWGPEVVQGSTNYCSMPL